MTLTVGFEPTIPRGLVFKTSALPGYATSAITKFVEFEKTQADSLNRVD